MRTYLLGAICAVIGGSMLSPGVQAAQINIFAAVSVLDYSLELEINDFNNATAIDLVHPDFGTVPLIFDSGEGNWDVVSEGLLLSAINSFFATPFTLEITHSGGLSIYTSGSFGPLSAGDFPDLASSLNVGPSANPLRPTASWIGGDDTADSMIITYETGDDEFTDGFEAPEVDGTRTISFDLEPGMYEVTLGFYLFLDPFSLSLTSGDDVLGIDQINPAAIAETFSGVTVVPIPAAVWLFGAGLLGLVGIAKKKYRLTVIAPETVAPSRFVFLGAEWRLVAAWSLLMHEG